MELDASLATLYLDESDASPTTFLVARYSASFDGLIIIDSYNGFV